ncbi:helix-turn-helix domain-containing protein [Taibaiella koreensis]|uniref:helix-turn-helix domain-containing protein n=1 Tax=Taibaiella koreensis TaxID=1268548 RepID=UPI000E5997DB|nr:AraC family transcriptional regulator [Taibaiella koreensis]
MKDCTAHIRYVGSEISPEQFIADHTLVYIIKGRMNIYDGSRHTVLQAGSCCIARKNRLARYSKEKVAGALEKVFVFFDDAFLRRFRERHKLPVTKFEGTDTLVPIAENDLLPGYMQSLLPYYHRGDIRAAFADVKREELLIILLEVQPELSGILFTDDLPQKINIEAFMNRNFKFNVSLERLAFLTGRSLSAFKRDFKKTFDDTPGRWLVKKRLQEAYFLITRKNKRPSDIYLDLGFEALSHFSAAFKKEFGKTPTELASQG